MKKIRYYLATIALLATLGGSLLQGMGLASLANGASSRHVSASFVAGHSAKPVASIYKPPCTYTGADC